ncbi:hypothetical protein SAMN06272735_3640 [Streptomyces sp. TLI_55]|uniref:hypothetical protein n=1 Tax=Streptomyces sp. TLI_55 TaxID=1938861 RepID=UPI000BD3C789|nr:hypothetical protein [Streptomyces sp. TLI_55]SNX61890.1 hypothetical protein SAMN06272735_3640 [Streptomyces sp. TLI_55]
MSRRTRRALAALCLAACLVACVTGCGGPREPAVSLSPDDTLKASQVLLTDRCLTRQGLTPPRPGGPPASTDVDHALFGTGRAELTLELPSGHVVGAHTDGCLAAAERRLYGDQQRWFRAMTLVNNLKSRAPREERAAYRELRAHGLTEARALLSASYHNP